MRRWPLFAAILYVALLFAPLFLVPTAPEVTASGARLVVYFQRHGDGVRVVTWLSAWSMVPLVLLIASLRSRLTGVGRDVMLLGAAGLITTTIVWSWISAGLALHPRTLDPNVARTAADIGAYFGPVLTVSIILMIVPVGIAAFRGDGGLPRWLAWVTAVFVAEQSIETITIFGRRGFIAPGGPMNFTLGAGLYLVWVLCAGAASIGDRRVDERLELAAEVERA
jgi:hypothetical protein